MSLETRIEARGRMEEYLKTIPDDALEAIVTQLEAKPRGTRSEAETTSLVYASAELSARYRAQLGDWPTAQVVRAFRELSEADYATMPKIGQNLFWALESTLNKRFPGMEEATDSYVDSLTREELDANDGKFCRFILDYIESHTIAVGWVVTYDGKTATVEAIDGNRVTLDDGRTLDVSSLTVGGVK